MPKDAPADGLSPQGILELCSEFHTVVGEEHLPLLAKELAEVTDINRRAFEIFSRVAVGMNSINGKVASVLPTFFNQQELGKQLLIRATELAGEFAINIQEWLAFYGTRLEGKKAPELPDEITNKKYQIIGIFGVKKSIEYTESRLRAAMEVIGEE